MLTPADVENAFVSFEVVALLDALLPLLLLEEDAFDDEAAVTVTVAVSLSEPPALPEADSVSVHVAAEDPAVNVQLCELDSFPTNVPTVFVAPETVQPELLLSVAVIAVVDPAVSVPELYIVADAVKLPLVETLLADVVSEVMLSEAGEVIVIEPQSAVQVEPMRTQTLCAPSEVGVIV
ncbi:hypothetical protein HY640_04115 [Candidatus Woesearchaeota archaeon]|nr:hypothetical protein [Candidatus Woesearchaeota archaeon]